MLQAITTKINLHRHVFFWVKIQLLHVTSHCVSSPMRINAANASGASTAATAEGCVVWFVTFQKDGSGLRMVDFATYLECLVNAFSFLLQVIRFIKENGSFFFKFLNTFFQFEPTLQIMQKYACARLMYRLQCKIIMLSQLQKTRWMLKKNVLTWGIDSYPKKEKEKNWFQW